MMADLRMLQEQSQVLQNLLGTLTDTLKAVNTRLDQQAETNRKTFADQKLVIDNLTADVRVIREKMDDNNVRIGSLTQEVESLRQSVQQMSTRPAAVTSDPGGTAPAGTAASAPGDAAPAPSAPAIMASPTQVFDAAPTPTTPPGSMTWPSTASRCSSRRSPRTTRPTMPRNYICASYLQDNRRTTRPPKRADVVIRTYPGTNSVPDAYFSQRDWRSPILKDAVGARSAWEIARSANFPGHTTRRRLAKQRLEQLKKP